MRNHLIFQRNVRPWAAVALKSHADRTIVLATDRQHGKVVGQSIAKALKQRGWRPNHGLGRCSHRKSQAGLFARFVEIIDARIR
ncbi:hypothetical protein NKH57_02320 [Mesorhizobium sp. M1050]|uniref:hypothetical protein n=1 Tax=unclassified Mesorhizobium TaxID=325217 RepID=UPI003335D1CA